VQQINISELKPHPRNNEFFDDMSGEKWNEFKESVKKRGVIEPIVITPEKVIVSGHQRVRACKELGIKTVMCDVHTYNNDDEILQDLLETNIRQRGDVGGSAKKVGLRIKELERLYGIQHGGDRKSVSKSNNFTLNETPQTETELADQMGITRQTLQNYKKLTEMIPELEELVNTGIVTNTTALAMMRNLSEKEQIDLISSLDTTKKITNVEIQKYIDEIKELKSNPLKPDDYDSTKEQLQNYKEDYSLLKDQYDKKVSELKDLKKQIENMKETTPTEQYNKKLKDSTIFFCSKVADFIEKTGGYVWLSDHLNELPDYERKSYVSAINAVYSWANTLLNNIND
jgi:hypothetical protein